MNPTIGTIQRSLQEHGLLGQIRCLESSSAERHKAILSFCGKRGILFYKVGPLLFPFRRALPQLAASEAFGIQLLSRMLHNRCAKMAVQSRQG